MGACDFLTVARGYTAREAFDTAVTDAQYEHGHGGYSGTIAEKLGFRMVDLPADKNARDFAQECNENQDHWTSDKWGDAGCIKDNHRDGWWVFFGWASE